MYAPHQCSRMIVCGCSWPAMLMRLVELQAMVLFYHLLCWLVWGERTSIKFGNVVEGLSFPTILTNTKSQPAHTSSWAQGQLFCGYDSFFYVGIGTILTTLTVSLPSNLWHELIAGIWKCTGKIFIKCTVMICLNVHGGLVDIHAIEHLIRVWLITYALHSKWIWCHCCLCLFYGNIIGRDW